MVVASWSFLFSGLISSTLLTDDIANPELRLNNAAYFPKNDLKVTISNPVDSDRKRSWVEWERIGSISCYVCWRCRG